MPNISSVSALADRGTEVTSSPNQGDGSPSPHHHSEGPANSRLLPHSSSHMPSSASPLHSSPQVHPRLQPLGPIRSAFHPSHRRTSEPLLPISSSSSSKASALHQESNSRKETASLKNAPVRQMWEDVSVLPRIPKIKRDSGGVTNGSAHGNSSSNSGTNSHGHGLPGRGMNSFAGGKGRQQSVDQHKGRNEGQARKPRPDAAASSSSSSSSSSSAFSNSFSSSSSSAASGPYQSSSSSAAVSFRINSSGNSWHSRRLNVGPPSCSGSAMPDVEKCREEAARKKQLRKDKQMLLASRTSGGNKEADSNNMYDPFNPTLSESCSSDDEADSTSLDNSSQCATQDEEASSLVKEELEAHSSDDWFCATNKTQHRKMVKEEAVGDDAQKAPSPVSNPQEHVMVKKEKGCGTEKQTWSVKVEVDSGSHSTPERKATSKHTLTGESKVNVDCSLVKLEKETGGEQNGSHDAPSAAPVVCKTEPCTSTPHPSKKKSSTEKKRDSKSPLKDLKEAPQESSSSESDRRRRIEPHLSDQGGQKKETKDQPSSKQYRRRVRSSSDTSHSDSSDGERRRKRRARSRSKERRRSRYLMF